MRKLLGPGLLLCAVLAACETKSPTGPSGNTPTTTTTTTVLAPTTTTTSSSTTTTGVLASLARRYTAFQPPPNVPADMTLFFELLQGGPVGGLTAFTPGRKGVLENEYKVTGVYVMLNGTTGTITGELGEALDPLETGGEFEGNLTATMSSGCTATRDFVGTVTSQTLQWTGGATGTTSNPCSPNPLTAFSTISMLRFDPNAPLPTPRSTTTTTIACSFSLTPTSDSVPSAGGARTVALTAPAGCAWTAQSFATWISTPSPSSGTGPATISYTVAASTAARSGSLLIAGLPFVVSQDAPPLSDLRPEPPVGTAAGVVVCRTDTGGNLLIGVRNLGPGDAGASVTRVVFTSPVPPVTTDGATPALTSGSVMDVPFAIPSSCYNPNCNFTVTVNVDGAVSESSTANNGATGSCLG